MSVRVVDGVERIKIPIDDPSIAVTDFVTDAFIAGSIVVF